LYVRIITTLKICKPTHFVFVKV